MKTGKFLTAAIAGAFLLSSCGQAPETKEAEADEKSHDEMHAEGKDHEHHEHHDEMSEEYQVELEKNGIKVYSANIAKEFPDAVLKMKEDPPVKSEETGKYTFNFEVENYELATQTEGASERHCANSGKGQHIHFIVNNGPYQAKYEPSFETDLMEGNNVILAFLSRSYHESIKNGKAFVLKTFQLGDSPSTFDHDAQHLFYSRPKGTYKGEDGKKILLDFYLINSELSESGNKVKVTIDDTEFTLASWQPYFVEGLTAGTHSFRIMLVDSNGEMVEGPFNDSGVREITVE